VSLEIRNKDIIVTLEASNYYFIYLISFYINIL
jgi:hypothetical protein